MILLNLLYLLIGLCVGFLVKYEIDIRCRKKRLERKKEQLDVLASDYECKQKETLNMVKELNIRLIQQQKEVHWRG